MICEAGMETAAAGFVDMWIWGTAEPILEKYRHGVRAAEEAVQIHGGYMEKYAVCRFYRDAKILTIGEGTDEVQQMVIARALGA